MKKQEEKDIGITDRDSQRCREGQTQLTFRRIISSVHAHVSLPLSTGGEEQSLSPHPCSLPLPLHLIPLFWSYFPSPIAEHTHRLHLLCSPPHTHPKRIIFTLTASINLTPSCTQTLTHTHTHTHTNLRVDQVCTSQHPTSITGVKVTGPRD